MIAGKWFQFETLKGFHWLDSILNSLNIKGLGLLFQIETSKAFTGWEQKGRIIQERSNPFQSNP